ncbi:MAG: GNAT family N-acetyltransferase, partial [Planctomycetes bacterium]|nr:GNAT family N-acetyltransferase [Planctomycetota bacterium]
PGLFKNEVATFFLFMWVWFRIIFFDRVFVRVQQLCFETLQLPRIVAVVEPTNTASCKVIEKIGLRFVDQRHVYGRMLNYYAAERDEYLQTLRG